MSRYVTLCHGVTFYTILYHAIQGDSGGPLTYQEGLQHTLIGIESWVRGWNKSSGTCDGVSSYFASVSYYRDWIDKQMEVSEFCEY